MRISIVSFSLMGAELAKRIITGFMSCTEEFVTNKSGKISKISENTKNCDNLEKREIYKYVEYLKMKDIFETTKIEQCYEFKSYITQRHVEQTGFEPFSSVYDLTAGLFYNTDALVYIGACGIAVRAIAPLVKSKLTDPAVVVCDETGRFAISLLSGHVGGANELSEKIAGVIGAMPVVTTASDSHSLMVNTKKNKNLILGIGCRKGMSAETIERVATILLWDARIPLTRVCEVATIDIKKGEEGLHRFVNAHKLPLNFYSAKELAAVPGNFSSSDRVLRAVGVDNVCERAAVLCGGTGKLILKKTAKDGVTVAVFEKDESVNG